MYYKYLNLQDAITHVANINTALGLPKITIANEDNISEFIDEIFIGSENDIFANAETETYCNIYTDSLAYYVIKNDITEIYKIGNPETVDELAENIIQA